MNRVNPVLRFALVGEECGPTGRYTTPCFAHGVSSFLKSGVCGDVEIDRFQNTQRSGIDFRDENPKYSHPNQSFRRPQSKIIKQKRMSPKMSNCSCERMSPSLEASLLP